MLHTSRDIKKQKHNASPHLTQYTNKTVNQSNSSEPV